MTTAARRGLERSGQAIAFARLHADGRVVIAIAPHLASGLLSDERPLPLGDTWNTSRVRLPTSLAALTLTDAFTGATLRPVGLLVAESTPRGPTSR